ncbi:MAG: ABC transporter substrate-binding protein [Lachnospiraceae bacterium]|nr:ABC transporter substrate-binding protein [Lachnospiraceae bacterium]
MKAVQKLLAVILMSATLTVALCGCGGDKADNASSITIGIPQDLEDSLDPHLAVAAGTKEILFNIFEGLVKPDKNGDLYPAVAESYEVSEDGLTYTSKLRKGVKFHDGSLVTADDVLYCISRNADDESGSQLASAFSNIKEYRADGDNIVIVLNQKDTDFLQYMTMAIIPKNNANPDTNPIGTGPYKYVSRSPQENIILTRFDDYYGEKAHIKDVTLKICASADSIVMYLLGGSIDLFARLSNTQVEQLKNANFDILEGTMNLVQALYLNNAFEPFKDERVRKALCYAVDRQEILDKAFGGNGSILGSSMFPAFGKYYIDETKDVYKPDLEKAKELLKEAGYESGLSFEITVPSNYQPHVDTAQVIVEQLKKVGVDAKIKLVEWDTWVSDTYVGRNYEATVIGVDASQMTARAMLERFLSDSGKNFVNYSNPEFDETLNKAFATTNMDEATKLYKDCEWILTNTAASVYIQDMAEFVAVNNKYTGYDFYPIYVMDIAKLRLK